MKSTVGDGEKPSNWRLEKAKQRRFSRIQNNGNGILDNAHDLLQEEAPRKKIPSVATAADPRGPPNIPLPPLPPSPPSSLTPVEAMVKSVLHKSVEQHIQSIKEDWEAVKKVRRQTSLTDSMEVNYDVYNDDERSKALRRHSGALSALSNSSASNRSSMVSEWSRSSAQSSHSR